MSALGSLLTSAPILVADGSGGGFWMPPQASDFAVGVDGLFDFILYCSIFFFVLLMGLTVYFAVKYKKKDDNQRTSPIHHSFKLEFLWSAIPTVLMVIVFAWGFRDFTALSQTPPDALDVRILGQKWSWTIQYPTLNKECANKLVLPVDRPFTTTMSSSDVIHSFWIPAMRAKRDVLPSRYTGFTVTPTRVGTYPFFCTEFCGQQHSNMGGTVQVLSQDDFAKWVASKDCPGLDPESPDYGPRLFKKFCASCHTDTKDGGRLVGPTLWGKHNTMEKIVGGPDALIDDNYIRESILYPEKQIVVGYEGENMPAFRGRLDDLQLNAIVDYIKTLKD